MTVPVRIYAQIGHNAPREIGSRNLPNKRTAVRDVANLLKDIAQAMDNEATFLEITDTLQDD